MSDDKPNLDPIKEMGGERKSKVASSCGHRRLASMLMQWEMSKERG